MAMVTVSDQIDCHIFIQNSHYARFWPMDVCISGVLVEHMRRTFDLAMFNVTLM